MQQAHTARTSKPSLLLYSQYLRVPALSNLTDVSQDNCAGKEDKYRHGDRTVTPVGDTRTVGRPPAHVVNRACWVCFTYY